jgi:hypothetical protein
MSGGRGNSRRRSYGRRQKELRDRRGLDLTIDLDGPTGWPNGGAWDPGPSSSASPRSDHGPQPPGGPA